MPLIDEENVPIPFAGETIPAPYSPYVPESAGALTEAGPWTGLVVPYGTLPPGLVAWK